MKLTDGEKSVWAATYAASRQAARAVENPRGTARWERNCVEQAIEEAWYAVEYMREAVPAIEEGWGDKDDVMRALREMLT